EVEGACDAALRGGAHLGERGDGEIGDRGLAPTGDAGDRIPVLDHSRRRPESVGPRGARRNGAVTLAPKRVLDRHGARGGVGHHLGDAVGGNGPLALLAKRDVLALDRRESPDSRADNRADFGAVVRRLVETGLGDRLGRRHQRELGEAVRATGLAAGQMIGGLPVGAAAEAVLDPGLAGGPALVECRGPHPQRGHRADPCDGDAASHDDWRAAMKSTTSWTVSILSMSASVISISYSSSITCESSTRSSESMSRSSKRESGFTFSGSSPNSTRAEITLSVT